MKKTKTIAKKRPHLLLLMLGFLLSVSSAQAQTKTVTGKVTSSSGEPIAGATVLAQNSKQATTTGDNGTFSLQVNSNVTVLVVSHVNYTVREVALENRNNVSVVL